MKKPVSRNGLSELRDFAVTKNPVLIEVVGLAPILAVATGIKAGLLLSAMMCCSLLITQALTVTLFKRFTPPVRMLLYFIVGSVISISALAVTDRFLPMLSAELGLFLPLTAVSSFTAVHCERYAAENTDVPFVRHALCSIAGYTAVTVIISAIRELAAFGTLFGLKITEKGTSKSYLMPFFALLLMGFMSAFLKAAAMRNGEAEATENAFMAHSVQKENMPDAEKFAAKSAQKLARRKERTINRLERKAESSELKAKKKEAKRAAREEKIEQKRERVERERLEKERLERERAERERLEKEKLERERAERERLEKEKLERERAERERLEKERLERERAERERLEKERLERERAERERLEKEKLERERAERERLEKEKLATEREQYKKREQQAAEERARRARSEIAERREKLRIEEELRKEAARKHAEELRNRRVSAEEEKLRMRAQAENDRLVRKAVLQEDRRRRKLGLPSLSEDEIRSAFSHGVHASSAEKRTTKNPYVMPLSDDESEDKTQ